ncbi:hypothetical protein C8Q77DRAFT_693631 [Trametes polyzona]|nr:hypothetical protein C8Q77DRAFT_693631 [Trametes polyzona]
MASRGAATDDLDVLLAELVLDEIEDDEEDEEQDELDFLAAFCLDGIEEARQMKNDARQRRYLRRGELLPDPRAEGGTPWQRVYNSRIDRAFITTMGIDVSTFNAILEGGFSRRWDAHTIPRPDVRSTGHPRLNRRSLDAAGALGLVLHWLSSTMWETSLQQIFALTPATVDRYLHSALDILLFTLDDMPDTHITWPSPRKMRYYSDLITRRLPLLVGAFGTVDGLNLAVQVSSDEDVENATYNGWLHDHFISNIICFCPEDTSQLLPCCRHRFPSHLCLHWKPHPHPTQSE